MNPWQVEQLAATHGEERRRVAAARVAARMVVPGRRPLGRAAAALAGRALVRVGGRFLEIGGVAPGPARPRQAGLC